MFETRYPDLPDLATADDAAVASAVAGWARIEAAAAARRLAAIAELVRRRTDVSQDRANWACDEWDSAAAEVAAALTVSHGKASAQMYLALTLRERLPRVARLFAEGRLSAQVVSVISWHTTLITDPEALAEVDAEVAREALRYGRLSANKTALAIDAIVDRHDPAALRRARAYARSRELVIDRRSDSESGTTALWGRLYATDAEVLERRLTAMAHEVCEDDPRTIAQRRADAMGALAAGADRLACRCENPECPAAQVPDRHSGVVIHVVADEASAQTPADPRNHGEAAEEEGEPARRSQTVKAPPALIVGGPLIPAPLLAELIAGGAKVRPLLIPGPDVTAEPGYRPSTALDEFVRCRDMTCRFPGCDRPATRCDIDHAVAFPLGATHPGNLRCLCRKHHLLKTFWGWRDRQSADGTITWMSPSGQAFTTYPGSRRQFPALCATTGELPERAAPPPVPGRVLMMPTRRRTRAQDRTRHIRAERALNADYAAERIAERHQPPPF